MNQLLNRYRQVMDKEQPSSGQYFMALMGLCNFLTSQNRHQEALIELEMYLDKEQGHALHLLECLNLYSSLTGEMPLPDAYAGMASRIEEGMAYSGSQTLDVKYRINEMHDLHRKSQQVFEKLQMGIIDLSEGHKIDALLDYLGTERIPYYREMAQQQITMLQTKDLTS